MALPSNVGHGTVRGSFIDSSGMQTTGKVIFTPTATRLLNPTATPSPVTILPNPVTVDLVEGAFTQALVATNDTDLNPVGWNYRVDFAFVGARPAPFFIDVPEGETVDLAVVSPVGQGNGTMITRGLGVPEWSTAEDGQAIILVDGEPAWGDVAGEVDLSGYATTAALTSGLADKANTSHAHAQGDVTGLSAALAAKADAAALGDYATATDLTTGLAGKAEASHTHAISAVTGLQTALDGKQAAGSYAAASHTHTVANVTGLQGALDGKAATSHTHTVANVTGLQSALDGKVGSPDASVTGLVWVGSVESLPPTGSAGVVYFVDQA